MGRPYSLHASPALCRHDPACLPAEDNSSASLCISVSGCARNSSRRSPLAYPAHSFPYPFCPPASRLPFRSSSSRSLSSLAPTTIQQYSPNKSRNTSTPPAAINHFIFLHLFLQNQKGRSWKPTAVHKRPNLSYLINPVSFSSFSSRQRQQWLPQAPGRRKPSAPQSACDPRSLVRPP